MSASPKPDALTQVRRAADGKRRAETEYREAILAALLELATLGVRDPFAQVAEAAGVSRQAVRQLASRSRT